MWKKIYNIIEFLNQKNLLYVLYILLLCFFIWGIPGKGLLYFGDVQASYIFSPEKVYGNLFIWKDLYNSGKLDYSFFQTYLFSFFVIISSFLFKLYWHSYLYSFMGYFLFSLSGFFLFKKFLGNKFSAFIIAIFFLLSPAVSLWHSAIVLIYSLAFINFALLYFYTIFQSANENRIKWKETIAISILLTFANVYFQNLFLLLYITPIFLLINFRYLFKNRIYFIKNILIIGLLYVLINIQWIFILVYQLIIDKNFLQIGFHLDSGMDIVNTLTGYTRFFDFFRVMPYSLGHLAEYDKNKILLILSFGVSIFAFCGSLFIKNKKFKKGIIFSLLLILVFYPLINGNKGLFKEYFLFFWNYVPLFKTFRTIIKLIIIALYATSYLLGVYIIFLQNKIKNKLVYVINIILLVVISTPIIVFYQPILRDLYTQDKIPADYQNLESGFNQPLESETMLMPQTNWLVTYKWRYEEKDTDNIVPFFYNGRVLGNGAAYENVNEFQNYNNYTSSLIINGAFDQLGYLFSYKNVKYILLQNDVTAHLEFDEETRLNIESNIKGNPAFFTKSAQFGDLFVFQIPEKFFNQQIFSPEEVYIINREKSDYSLLEYSPLIVSKILNKYVKNKNSVFVFQEQNKEKMSSQIVENYKLSLILDYNKSLSYKSLSQENNSNNEVLGRGNFNMIKILSNGANIEFKKISPVQYEVFIHNVQSDNVPLVFNEAFSPNWDLYPSDIKNQEKSISFSDFNINHKTQYIGEASRDEVVAFVKDNKISLLNSAFISKEYNKSIQNNNMLATPFHDILFRKKINSYNHFYANGFNNLYILNINEIYNKYPNSCIKNKDGSYDVRLTIFLSPQKYFYIAFGVSIFSILSFIVYLIYSFFRFRKKDKAIKQIQAGHQEGEF